MDILVIGLGSMGKRRIRLIKQYDSSIKIFGCDSRLDRRSEVKDLFEVQSFESIEAAVKTEKIDCAFICTSPLSHSGIIKDLIHYKIHTFSELNLVSDGYSACIEIEKKMDPILFLSSTLVYRKDLQAIKTIITNKKANYIYHSGQYLPDWHPWEKIENYFVTDKRSNGCREIFGIELPWLIKTFGKIKNVYSLHNNITDLSINFPDSYAVILEHETGTIGQLTVDIVSRKATRHLEVITEGNHIFWDGTPDSLNLYNPESKQLEQIQTYNNITKDKNYCSNIIENAYMDEIAAFFNAVYNNDFSEFYHSYQNDLEVLSIIDKIEA